MTEDQEKIMSLCFHLGSSGAGKTTGIQKKIIKEAAADLNRNYLFLVPEQFTLQTQREILERSGNSGMYNIDALSFNRLCWRVFDEQGLAMPQVLEDTGKSMIVKKVVLEHRDELTIYRSKVKKQGFIEEMKSLIAEFYQYGIDGDRIEEMQKLAGDRRILKDKLHDIKIIYDAFKKFIDGRFVMNEEIIDRMCDIAADSGLLKDSVIVLDGFTGFTPSQYNCINVLMKYCRDIHVVLSISRKEAEKVKKGDLRYEGSLFELTIKTVKKLSGLAEKNNVPTDTVIYDDEKGRYSSNPSLAHLEKNIFRFPYSKSADHRAITLLSASDRDEETDFVLAKLRELVFDAGKDGKGSNIRYENIAVLSGDVSAYGDMLERKFRNAGIPVFIDEKHSIAGMNIVDLIDSVLETELFDYSYESVFRFLKTGLTGIGRDDIARMENYVIARGIKGARRWKQEWKKKAPGIESINETREKTAELLSGFSECEKKKPTVTERLTALYELLDSCNVEEQLYFLSEELKKSTDPKKRIKGTEYGQLFKTVVTVFERINGLLGEERMELEEFKDVLDTGFSEAKLRRIPGGADSVVVGDIERTRIDNKKVIFFIGCNDSVIPKNSSSEGLLNEFDRELFAENDIELSPTKRDSASLNELYLYLALTKPSERLYITYARSSADEKDAGPAYIFGRIMKLYEGLEIQRVSGFEKDNAYRLLGSDRGLGTVISELRKGTLDENSLAGILAKTFKAEDPQLMKLLAGASSGKKNRRNLTKKEAEELYGRVIIGSITRLQKFAECAFAHFASYGLKLKERQEYRLGSLELGNIYHDSLQNFAESLKQDGIKWSECPTEEQGRREAKAVEKALLQYEDIIGSSKRIEYFRTSIKRVIARTVDIVTKQLSLGEFDVAYVEKGFSHESSLMKLTGKIDRLDIVRKKGKTYIRVIDYKTGKTAFDMDLVKAGLQLQLAIYTAESLAELREMKEDTVPAGMYYYKIDDPILDHAKSSEKDRMAKLRLDGLTVDEDEIIALHDKTLVDENGRRIPEKSDVINYNYTKDGKLYKGCEKSVIPRDDFERVAKTASDKAKSLAEEILAGRVEVDPYENKGSNPCSFCAYAGVCGFDRRRGDTYRSLTK